MLGGGDGRGDWGRVFYLVVQGELIGGSQREERLEQLEAKMVEFGLNPEDYWWYNDLRRLVSSTFKALFMCFLFCFCFRCMDSHDVTEK